MLNSFYSDIQDGCHGGIYAGILGNTKCDYSFAENRQKHLAG